MTDPSDPPLVDAGPAEPELDAGPGPVDDAVAESRDAAEIAAFYRLDERQAAGLTDLLGRFESVAAGLADASGALPAPELAGGDEDLDRYRRPPPGEQPQPDPAIALGDDAAEAVAALADPDVAAAFVSQAIGIRADHAAALFQFASAALAQAPRPSEAACRWLVAKALDRLGHPVAAAAQIDAAMRLDGAHELAPLVLDAAMLASDRGDLDASLRLAREAGLDERDGLVRLLTDLVPSPPAGLGRNDPCFCGSGRKYKQCHLGRRELALEERAAWLHRKAEEWLQDRTWRLRLIEIADAYVTDDADDDEVLQLALHEPFIADLALTEDGAWSDFLADRGALLPADERALAESWVTIGRSVYEVVAVEPGSTIDLRDLRSIDPDGEAVSVAEARFSEHVLVGDLLLAHVLPVGPRSVLLGGIVTIAAVGREPLVDALDAGSSGLELARLVGAMRRGPTITNTEGEPLIFCGATYAVADPDAARAALDADPALRPDVDRPTDGEDEGIDPFDASWVEPIVIEGRDWIRARFTLRGGELVLEANSEVRIDRAKARVERSIDGAELIDEEQRPLDHLADEAPLDPRSLLGGSTPITPDLQAVLDQIGPLAPET